MRYPSTWTLWWAGDGIRRPRVRAVAAQLRSSAPVRWRQWAEIVVLIGGLVALTYARTCHDSLPGQLPRLPVRHLGGGALPADRCRARRVDDRDDVVWAAIDAVGPFADNQLLARTLSLQMFDAVVALTSFVSPR